jgi:hypothetical protein
VDNRRLLCRGRNAALARHQLEKLEILRWERKLLEVGTAAHGQKADSEVSLLQLFARALGGGNLSMLLLKRRIQRLNSVDPIDKQNTIDALNALESLLKKMSK